MREYYAHTPNSIGKWHDLKDHLTRVSRMAGKFAESFGGKAAAEWTGVTHDIGKFGDEFQEYLHRIVVALQEGVEPPTRGPDHSSLGAILASYFQDTGLATIIAGHHGGMPSKSSLDHRLVEKMRDKTVKPLLELAARQLPNVLERQSSLMPERILSGSIRQKELFLRFVFSALVDADFLDTESHFDPELGIHRQTDVRDIPMLRENFFSRYAEEFGGAEDTTVNRVRRDVFNSCIKAANNSQGVFRLTVPTGGGKTLASLAFALEHAQKHKLDRIIVAIPYTSIIEQTAHTFRRFLGEDVVLEHHSMAKSIDSDSQDPASVRLRLATENWDLPVVITTTVQLFNSLFSNRPSQCRKLHRIARSVVVLDEVQSLPGHFLTPILDVIQELVRGYNVSTVLCTATQPAYTTTDVQLEPVPQEIVPNFSDHFDALKRVEYKWEPREWSWKEVASIVEESDRILVILNTIRDAQSLLDELVDLDGVFHLSANLYPAHRRRILERVKHRLAADEPCRLISTQVVEAGVDLDFPIVMRATGPLESMVQAAGRCNREGRHENKGKVILFDPKDGHAPPGAYRTAMAEALKLLREGKDLHDPEIFNTYFSRYYMAINQDAKSIQKLRGELDYPEVAKRFQLISDETQSVIIQRAVEKQDSDVYAEQFKLDQLINQAKFAGLSRSLLRQLSQYTVNIYPHAFRQAQQKGLIGEILPGLLIWRGGYDDVRGLTGVALDTELLVV